MNRYCNMSGPIWLSVLNLEQVLSLNSEEKVTE